METDGRRQNPVILVRYSACSPECVEQCSCRERLQARHAEVLVLSPDRRAQLQCERDGGPVVRIAAADQALRLGLAMAVDAHVVPDDREEAEGSPQLGLVKPPLTRQFGG